MATLGLSLRSQKPTEITPESLKAQLDSIGLNCPDANEERLQVYIDNTRAQMADGHVRSFMITRLKNGRNSSTHSSVDEGDYVESADGSWTTNSSFSYHSELLYINYEEHFNWLQQFYPKYCRMRCDQPQSGGVEPTVMAIQEQFISCSYAAAAAVVNGVSQGDIEAAMSNAIAPLTNDNAQHYDESDSRCLFLVNEYDEANETASGLGILTITWRLRVWDYREKSKDNIEHKWTLDVSAWSALYSQPTEIDIDYSIAHTQFE